MLSLQENQWKKNLENKNIYRCLYYIPNIKLKIMLYEPFVLNMVSKSTETFGNLSLEKYGIFKWKMCRNPVVGKLWDLVIKKYMLELFSF